MIFYLHLYYQSRKTRSGVTFTYNVEKVAEDITGTWMKSYQKWHLWCTHIGHNHEIEQKSPTEVYIELSTMIQPSGYLPLLHKAWYVVLSAVCAYVYVFVHACT